MSARLTSSIASREASTAVGIALLVATQPVAAQRAPDPDAARAPGIELAGGVSPPGPVTSIPGTSQPTSSGTGPLSLRAGLEVFTQYALRLTNTDAGGSEWFHAFEVPRAHASLSGRYGDARARVVFEAVRSASEGALLGVAGDSLVLRVREAWAGYHRGDWLEVQAGVVPTLTVPAIEGAWRLRAVGATPLEVTGLSAPADLGVTARVRLFGGVAVLGVGAYNGDGYAQRELNRGKNVEATITLRPWTQGTLGALAVFASYVNGSSGTGLARADRVTGAVLWQGARLRGGLTGTYGWGVGDDGAQESLLLEGFVSAEPVARWIVGARVTWWQRDTREDTDRMLTVLGTTGWRIADPLEAFVAVSRQVPGARLAQSLPGADLWEFRAVTRVVF